MNSKQNSTKTMYRRVSNFIKKYLQILGVLPNFTALQTEFEANLTQLARWEISRDRISADCVPKRKI